MGIYTNSNRFGGTTDYASQIPANEAYDAAFGCAHIIADCAENDRALFEAAILSDMQEVRAIQEGVEVVTEGALSNVIKKIVEMFKKLLAKIKGIFKAFIAKLTGAFKNGKDLVKKYEKQILKYSNWKGFKLKGIRKPKNGDNIIEAVTSVFKTNITDNAYVLNLSAGNGDENRVLAGTKLVGIDPVTSQKISDMEADDLKLAILKTRYIKDGLNISDYKELGKEVTDYLYDDEDTLDGEDDNISSSSFTVSWIKGVLIDEKWKDRVEKVNKGLDDLINKIIDQLNKTDDAIASIMVKNGSDTKINGTGNTYKVVSGVDNDKPNKNAVNKAELTASSGNFASKAESVQKAVHTLQKIAALEQEVVTNVTSEHMSQVKFAIGQARKIWTAAAVYSSGVHKEEAEYVQAVGECAEEQFYTNMEAIH